MTLGAKMSERERIAQLIRIHFYDTEDETCNCVSGNATSKVDIVHMSIMEHSLHVADRIQWRRHRKSSYQDEQHQR
jgi:hypothetical protein